VPITMVYVPSPLSIYRHAEETISFCSFFGAGLAQEILSQRHHDAMRDMVAGISADQRVDFVDATPALRETARTRVIHGPIDWDHLNKTGYETLGTLVAARFREQPQESPREPSDDRSRTTSLGSSSRSTALFAHDSHTPAPSASEVHQTR